MDRGFGHCPCCGCVRVHACLKDSGVCPSVPVCPARVSSVHPTLSSLSHATCYMIVYRPPTKQGDKSDTTTRLSRSCLRQLCPRQSSAATPHPSPHCPQPFAAPPHRPPPLTVPPPSPAPTRSPSHPQPLSSPLPLSQTRRLAQNPHSACCHPPQPANPTTCPPEPTPGPSVARPRLMLWRGCWRSQGACWAACGWLGAPCGAQRCGSAAMAEGWVLLDDETCMGATLSVLCDTVTVGQGIGQMVNLTIDPLMLLPLSVSDHLPGSARVLVQ